MHTNARRENNRGAMATDENLVLGPFVLDCGEITVADAALQIVLRRSLNATGHRALRQLKIELRPSKVVLRGEVPTYYLKQLAQSAIRVAAAPYEVVNLVTVANSS